MCRMSDSFILRFKFEFKLWLKINCSFFLSIKKIWLHFKFCLPHFDFKGLSAYIFFILLLYSLLLLSVPDIISSPSSDLAHLHQLFSTKFCYCWLVFFVPLSNFCILVLKFCYLYQYNDNVKCYVSSWNIVLTDFNDLLLSVFLSVDLGVFFIFCCITIFSDCETWLKYPVVFVCTVKIVYS